MGSWEGQIRNRRASEIPSRPWALSEGLTSFVDDPHAAIEGQGQGNIVNLADHRAEASRRAQVELLQVLGADGVAKELGKMGTAPPLAGEGWDGGA